MPQIDTGLAALTVIASFHKIPTDLRQLQRSYILDNQPIDTTTLVRAGRDIKLKVRALTGITEDRLQDMVYPAILKMKNGRYIVIMEIGDDKLLIVDPAYHLQKVMPANREKVMADWTGDIILFTRRYNLEEKLRKFNFSWFIPEVTKYSTFIRNVFFISFLLQLLGLASPIFTQVIIDRVLVHRSTDALDVLVLGMLLTNLFTSWMEGIRSYLFTNITFKIDAVLSSRLFKTLTALPISFYSKYQVGDVISRTGEMETLRQFITSSSISIILDIIFTVVYLAVMIYYSIPLSVVVIVMLPLFALLNIVAAPLYKRIINQRFLINSENRSFLVESITGIHTVKSSGTERLFLQRYEDITARLAKASFSLANLSNVTNCIGTLLQQVFSLAILWVGALYVMDGELSVGQLIAFQMMASHLISPIMRLVGSWMYFQQIMVSMDRLGDIMNEKCEASFNPSRTTLPEIRGEIGLDNLSFRYTQDGRNVLNSINLKIAPGSKVGIVGRSGSGKSTLTKLIQQLYLPTTGRIMVDGVDIAQVEPAWLRRQIGVVLQDSMLFNGTIEDNIRIACPNASHEDVERAAKLAGADSFVNELQNGYSTNVGERGSLLSGGQRQRVAIARALLSNPRIIIFDEATSALDYESEATIMKNINEIAKGRTLLMIAHRLSTVEGCDAILVMDKGKVIEAGKHEELLKRKGLYYHLYMAQSQ